MGDRITELTTKLLKVTNEVSTTFVVHFLVYFEL